MAVTLAILAVLFLGTAVVTGKLGLKEVSARTGTAINVAASTMVLLCMAPFLWEGPVVWRSVATFAAVGLFYPALVALLRFRSTDLLGPATTSAILASVTPVCAVAIAALWLQERIPTRVVVATSGIAVGVAMISLGRGAVHGRPLLWWFLLPLTASLISGSAQVLVKSGLAAWPSPFAAALIAYLVSTLIGFGALFTQQRSPSRKKPYVGVAWFVCTGVLNGTGVLAMFAALNAAPVSVISPIIATYPLVTLFLGAAVLADESLNTRRIVGALLAIASVAYLVSA